MSPATKAERRKVDRSRFPVDPWRLVEARWSGEELGVTETLFSVGNGYLGTRGNVEEGRESHTHGTFINGFHETWQIRHAEEAYGLAQQGQTIVSVPDAKVIRLYVDDEPLLIPVADLVEYERALDFRRGELNRGLLWRTPSGKQVRVSSTRMISFTERHLMVMTFEVEMVDEPAAIAISSQILNRQDGEDEYHVASAAMGASFDPRRAERFSDRVLQPVSQWHDDERLVLTYRCTNSGMTLAVAADHVLETANHAETRGYVGEDLAKHVFRVDAQPGVPSGSRRRWRTTRRAACPRASSWTAAAAPWTAWRGTGSSGCARSSRHGCTTSGSARTSRSRATRARSRRSAGTSSSSRRPRRGPRAPASRPRG